MLPTISIKSLTTRILPALKSLSISYLLANKTLTRKSISTHISRRSLHTLFLRRPSSLLNHHQQEQQHLYHIHRSGTCAANMSGTNNNNENNNNDEKAMKIPSPPFAYFSSSSNAKQNGLLDLAELDATISISETKRQEAYDSSAKIKVLITKARRSLENKPRTEKEEYQPEGNHDVIMQELETLIQSTLPPEKQSVRLANLSFQFQDYARLKSYQYFLSTGKLLPQSHLPSTISDEEYLAGVIGLTQDLARYVIGRATARDGESVILARYLVDNLLSYLMKFDFRNGMLRRKYDGVKYALKTCETVLYELSVTGMEFKDDDHQDGKKDNGGQDCDGSEPETKRIKTEVDNNMNNFSEKDNMSLPYEELEQLRQRIEHRDELREKLIKRCRDAQKSAKQAIFALHRNDFDRACNLITQCENMVKSDLNPLVAEDPSLYFGSYSNVLEEYAEAKLFQVWLLEEPQRGRLLMPNDFSTIRLEPTDYLGGLCDLTGEIGRFAVQRGTKRDIEDVQFCLETNLSILFSLETLQRFPSGSQINKKMEQLKRTVEKLERMLYELSLVQATGRQIVADSVNQDEPRKESENND